MAVNLYHGDCRKVIPTLEPFLADCLLVDPPYGVGFKSTFGKDPEAIEQYQTEIEDDMDPVTAIATFDQALLLTLPHLADVCEIYIFSHWSVADWWQPYLRSLSVHGIELYQMLIWEKGYPGIGDVKYNWGAGHESIYYLKKGRRRVPYRRSGILHVDKVRPGTNIHPTEKPIELIKILIEYSTVPGQMVFDPFAGSASTLVAARELGRNAIGIERKESHFRDAQVRLASGGLLSL